MANRIFTNGEEGKILTSVGNRIIKQPYEFGNAFQNRMGLNNYFEISGLTISNGYSAMWISKMDKLNPNEGQLQFISSSLNKADNIGSRYDYMYYFNLYDSYTAEDAISSNDKNGLRYVEFDTTSRFFIGSSLSPVTGTYITSNRDKVRVGTNGAITNTSNSTIPQQFMSSTSLFNKLYIYSRKLSLQEIMYCRNNLLFNDVISREGLYTEINFNFAEILDFSQLQNGSDMRVGCRDYSGFNRHGEIMNLPAGTLQQKLDYANANLFVPFI